MPRHIVSATDYTGDDLKTIFGRARLHKGVKRRNSANSLEGMLVALAFEKPSTRTYSSFYAAMVRCGGNVLPIPDAGVFSSFSKDESIEDTIEVLSDNCDAIVMRHGQEDAAARAATAARVPFINAGNGTYEHPTQALLDLFTIWEACESGRLPRRPLRIEFFGDNTKSRTVRSLGFLLEQHAKTLDVDIESVRFSGPAYCWQPPIDLLESFSSIPVTTGNNDPVAFLPQTDVLYLTRTQREHYTTEERAAMSSSSPFVFTRTHAELMPKHALIMHPLPRNFELSTSVDADKRAFYFPQAANGWPVRAALLELLLDVL